MARNMWYVWKAERMKRQDKGMTGRPRRLIRFWFTNAWLSSIYDSDKWKLEGRDGLHWYSNLLPRRRGSGDRRLVLHC